MPWQQDVFDVATEVMPDGSWAYTIVVVTVPRQAGKTTLFGPVAEHRTLIRPACKCWLTAQTRQDARDTWMDVVERLRRSPLAGSFRIRESNGSESITSPSGSTFRPFAPTEDALHGKANELVGVDEAWAFDAAQGAALDQAILPTFTTTGGQLWIISTAGTSWSTWLLGYVQRARAALAAGQRDTIALFDYGVTDEGAAVIERGLRDGATDAETEAAFDAVLAAHPATGYTVKKAALRQAAASMSPGDFLRAFGNYWTAATDQIIPEHDWQLLRVPVDAWTAPDLGSTRLALAVSPDGRDASLGVAWRPRPGAPARVDVVDARPGTSWVDERAAELRTRWRITSPVVTDSAGPVLDVADRLRRKGIEVEALPTRSFVASCSAFLAAVLRRDVEHVGRPDLDRSVRAAARRQVGDGGWAWSRLHSAATIAPLEAVTLALWGLDHAPEAPPAPVVVAARRRDSASSRRNRGDRTGRAWPG